tara:strand:+ start:483 stop:1046 length:564 start_codon:yes stop_codon:yes gene_type:complete
MIHPGTIPATKSGERSLIEVKITPELVERAKKKTAHVGILQGSITGSTSHVVGALGELIVSDLTGALEANNRDYDLLLGDRRIDVKTKRCNTKPRDYYDCTIPAHGTKQDCDSYVFVRVKIDETKAWVLGEIDKRTFYEKATHHKRGDIDPDNGFVFKADCYNLPIKELEDVEGSTVFAHGALEAGR